MVQRGITYKTVNTFFLFMTECAACGSSWARGQIRATAVAYATDMATGNLSCICDLHHSLQQCQILNPLNEARN